ncbi:hypothetical protein ACA910_019144 [Epithemia clementina (nom. ined.)]
MEPALDVIGRTLHGDSGARAFLERTSSIYVLDVTDPQNPKTYGCWNFIHQALNEVERYESSMNGKINQVQHNNNNGVSSNGYHAPPVESLVPHVRLLASMALRVARRSHKGDRAIVRTCIANASDYHCSPSQAQWLFDLNLELREIVMGRIAAIAFDFSYHRHNAAAENSHSIALTSAFADGVIMDTFSAVLAANAVASGPAAVRHFATEWIIPSSRNIPVLALVSVTHHLALEGMRRTAPAGTIDMLQQLSVPICSMVIVPAMAEAASDNNEELESKDNQSGAQQSASVHANNSRILAKALMALDMWCGATTLTLPQLRHISNKVHLGIVDILNDIMYSDSPEVVGAMADFIDRAMDAPLETEISEHRMNQVRHIINVNESAFKANFSEEHLRVIENKELASILEELSSSVALQRIRFVELQKQGNLEVCRNLARIGRGLASAWLHVYRDNCQAEPERGLIAFLFRTLSHPSIKIHGITLGVVAQFVSIKASLARELLPMLQRKAIIPHQTNEAGMLSLLHTDQYGVTIDEFLLFREHVVADALCACWKFDSEAYLSSCTCAIEEFCSGETGANLSFHLEAALFCVESVGRELTGSSLYAFSGQLSRCVASLSKKATCVTTNPLSVARLALFLQKWAIWFQRNEKIASAGDLAVTALSYSLVLSNQAHAQAMIRDTLTSPVLQACIALKEIISVEPDHFATESNLNALVVVWQSLYSERKRGMPVSLDSIEPLGCGMCTAILYAEESLRPTAFESLASPLLDSIEQLLALIKMTGDESSAEKLLDSISEEVKLLASLMRTISSFPDQSTVDGRMEEDDDDSEEYEKRRGRPSRVDLPLYTVSMFRRGWPTIKAIAAEFHENSNISSSICELMAESIPCRLNTDDKAMLLNEFLSVILAMVRTIDSANSDHIFHVCHFLEALVAVHGQSIFEPLMTENDTNGTKESGSKRSIAQHFHDCLLKMIAKAEPYLGLTWIELGNEQNFDQKQGQGQEAFESRSSRIPMQGQGDCHCLGPVLLLLREMRLFCPAFLLASPAHLPGEANDLLIARAAHSAVHALSANDSSIVLSAIEFLDVLIRPRAMDSEAVVVKLSNALSISRVEVFHRLLVGCCGGYEHSLLGPTANLLFNFFRLCPSEQLMLDITSAFQNQQEEQHVFFQLGDNAKELVQICLSRKSSLSDQGESTWTSTNLRKFLEQIWDLHRNTLDASTLPDSDAVSRFMRRYAVL